MNYASSLNVDGRNKALESRFSVKMIKKEGEKGKEGEGERDICRGGGVCSEISKSRDGTNGQRRGRRDKRDTRDTGELGGRCFAV